MFRKEKMLLAPWCLTSSDFRVLCVLSRKNVKFLPKLAMFGVRNLPTTDFGFFMLFFNRHSWFFIRKLNFLPNCAKVDLRIPTHFSLIISQISAMENALITTLRIFWCGWWQKKQQCKAQPQLEEKEPSKLNEIKDKFCEKTYTRIYYALKFMKRR